MTGGAGTPIDTIIYNDTVFGIYTIILTITDDDGGTCICEIPIILT